MIMRETTGTKSCARTEDLVAYLYGEAAQDEARDFEAHARGCDACRTELAAFADVREAVCEWRQQALGASAPPAFEEKPRVRAEAPARESSAMAALRQFFTLSPAWMRAAMAATVMVFCALAVITVAYFVRGPQTVFVERLVESGYSEMEVEARIARALKEQTDSRVKEAPAPTPASEQVASRNQSENRPRIKPVTSDPSLSANNSRKQRERGPRIRTQPPAVETAATDYLPFTASVDDEKLPSLSDLVDAVK
jgi:hypothetical protein